MLFSPLGLNLGNMLYKTRGFTSIIERLRCFRLHPDIPNLELRTKAKLLFLQNLLS